MRRSGGHWRLGLGPAGRELLVPAPPAAPLHLAPVCAHPWGLRCSSRRRLVQRPADGGWPASVLRFLPSRRDIARAELTACEAITCEPRTSPEIPSGPIRGPHRLSPSGEHASGVIPVVGDLAPNTCSYLDVPGLRGAAMAARMCIISLGRRDGPIASGQTAPCRRITIRRLHHVLQDVSSGRQRA